MSDYVENINKLLEINTPAAIEQLEREHASGNLVSSYLLGKVFFDGIYAPIDGKKAVTYWEAGAARGSIDCEKSIGDAYFFGIGYPENDQKALQIYQTIVSKNQNEVHSLCQIGRMHGHGWGVQKNIPYAIQLLEEAWKKGSGRAATEIGLLYMFDMEKNTENIKAAIKWYQRGADKGDSKGCYRMALLYQWGDYGVVESPKTAYRYLIKAKELSDALSLLVSSAGCGVASPEELNEIIKEAERRADYGDSSLMEGLGQYYAKKGNKDRSSEWYLKAIEAGDTFAEYQYGVKFALGMDGFEQDPQTAYKYLHHAAEAGQTYAYKSLADLLDDEYIYGLSIEERDYQRIHWLEKAVEAGDEWCAITLGRRYENGYSPVQKDVAKAIYYYQFAADKNNDSAYLPLGKLYMEPGLTANYKLAHRYLTMAKDFVYTDYFMGEIEFHLGKMAKDGLGRPQNLEEARTHYTNALSKGYTPAEEELKHFKKGFFGWKLVGSVK